MLPRGEKEKRKKKTVPSPRRCLTLSPSWERRKKKNSEGPAIRFLLLPVGKLKKKGGRGSSSSDCCRSSGNVYLFAGKKRKSHAQ